MRKLLVVVLAFLLLSYSQKKETVVVDFTYMGYFRDTSLNDFVLLQFEIDNKTNDTVYLSAKNIDLKVFKNAQRIIYENAPTYLPFVKPIKTRKEFECKEKEQYGKNIEALKLNFANKLYLKNFGVQKKYEKDKNDILENIIQDCIILMPNESINYNISFYSKKFDKTCKVSAKYLDSKSFTYFIDDSGKKIDIMN